MIKLLNLTAKKLFVCQFTAHIALIYWLCHLPSLHEIFIVFGIYFLMGCLGMSVTYHRLLTHKSFKTYRICEQIGTIIATLGLTGSSITWTAAHRQHHSRADQPLDPHSPVILGYLRAQYLSMFSPINIRKSSIFHDRFHQFMHRYYLHINLIYGLLLYLLGGSNGVLLFWLVPAAILWNAGSLINTVCHSRYLGYRKYDVKDNSVNNPILGILMWGEGWHNNHHRYQNRPNIGERWWELDIGYLVCILIGNKEKC